MTFIEVIEKKEKKNMSK